MFDLFEEEDEMGRPKKKNDDIADDQPDMSTPASKKTKLTTEISGDFNNGVGNDISVNSRGRPRRSICLSKYQIVPMNEDIQVIEGDKEHQNPPRKKKVRKGRKVMGSMEETMNHLILLLEERKASEAMLSKTRNPSLANIKSEVRMSKYKTMYINCQKKIKSLEDENNRLRKKLKATTGKLEKYEKEKLGESEKVEDPCFGSTLTKAAQAILDLSSPPTTDDLSSPAVTTEPKSTDDLSTPAVRTEPKSLPSKATKKAVAVKVSKKALRGSKKKTCMHCGTSKTPQWRAGPLGAGTLCNACGVRFRSGKLLPEYRPLASPSFDDKVHSNNHKKIMASPSLDDKVHSNNHKEIVETMIEQN